MLLPFEIDLSLVEVLLFLILSLLISFFLYFNIRNRLSKLAVVLLTSLRTFFLFFLILLIYNPKIISFQKIDKKPILVFAKDNSKSVTDNIDQKIQKLYSKLSSKYDIELFSFSENLIEGLSDSNSGNSTNYSNLFNEIHNKFVNKNLSSIIIATDGLYNRGLNPEYLNYDYPVHCIALGDTNQYNDVRIENVLSNKFAFLNDEVPFEVSISSFLTKNQKTNLLIYNNDKKLYEKEVKLERDKDFYRSIIYLPLNSVGLQNFDVIVDGVENEKNIQNNKFSTVIDVIDDRHDILILKDGASPDLSVFKNSIINNVNYNIDIKDKYDKINFEQYDLVACFNFDSLPVSLINKSIPLIIFNVNKYIFTQVGSSIQTSVTNSSNIGEVSLSNSFDKYILKQEMMDIVSEMPPLFSRCFIYDYNENIDVIFSQKILNSNLTNPAMFIENFENNKVAFINSEGWFLWKYLTFKNTNENEIFNDIFLKLTKYLLHNTKNNLFDIQIERSYFENEEIFISASIINELFQKVNNRKLFFNLFNKKGDKFIYNFDTINDRLFVNIGVLDIGEYTFNVSNDTDSILKSGSFKIVKNELEMKDISANHEILQKISNLSKGELFYPNDMDALSNKLFQKAKNKKLILKNRLSDLIDFTWLLLISLMLIFAEWFFRKYYSLI